MRLPKRHRAAVVAASLALTALVGGVTASSAGAAAPPWQTPGPADPNSIASLTFYDATGNQIFGGSIDSAPFAAYALASGSLETGDTGAFLSAYLPQASAKGPGAWTGSLLTAASNYPNAAASSFENGNPLYTGTPGDTTLADFIATHPNTSADPAYQNIYEIRLRTSRPGQAIAAQYAAADIKINGNNWQVVFPGNLQSTTTTLSATPGTGDRVGQSVTLKATVSLAAPGSVQFVDGTKNLGTPVTVATATGTASKAITLASTGTHHYSAVFTPDRLDLYAGSTGTKSVTVAKAVSSTTNALVHTTVKHTVHAVLTVVVKATGVTPTGTLTVYDGSTKLTTAKLVAANRGKRNITLPLISKIGKHVLHAVYAGSSTVAGSSARTVTLTVTR